MFEDEKGPNPIATLALKDPGPLPLAPDGWQGNVFDGTFAEWVEAFHARTSDENGFAVPADALLMHTWHQIKGRRTEFEAVKPLAVSIAIQGQQQSISVIPLTDGTAVVVIGHRRWNACRSIRKDFPVRVERYDGDVNDLAAIIGRVTAENMQRVGLSIPQMVCAAFALVPDGNRSVTGPAINAFAAGADYSVTHVRNLVRVAKKIDRRILDARLGVGAWMEHPAQMGIEQAQKLVTHDADMQWKIWNGEDTSETASERKVDKRTLERMLSEVRAAKAENEKNEAIVARLYWMEQGLLTALGQSFQNPLDNKIGTISDFISMRYPEKPETETAAPATA